MTQSFPLKFTDHLKQSNADRYYITEGTWRMREQCVAGSLSSFSAQKPGDKAKVMHNPYKLSEPPLSVNNLNSDHQSIDCNWGSLQNL